MTFPWFLVSIGLALATSARLTAAQPGSLDPSFDPGSGADDLVKQVVVLNDGKILVAGYFNTINGIPRRGIARLEATGAVDPLFDPGAGANNGLSALAVQTDGKIIIGGEFTQFDGTARGRVARLNAEGKLDPSFDPGSGATGTGTPVIFSLAVQGDGQILVGGSFTNFNGVARNHLVRLGTNGQLDNGFNARFDEGTGKGVFRIKTLGNGQIMVGGVFTKIAGSTRSALARLNSDGSLDSSFDAKFDEFSVVFALDAPSDQRLVAGGLFVSLVTGQFCSLAALNGDGSFESTFRKESPPDDQVNVVVVQRDGKLLIGGYFKTIGGVSRKGVARLLSDGNLDTQFDPGAGVAGGAKSGLLTLFPQNDGHVVIGGDFTTVNGTARRGIARLIGASEVVITPVTITQQPSGQTVCPGLPVTLSVGATGTGPLSYQWRKDGAPIANGLSSTYSIAQAGPGDAGTYDAVVTGAAGPVTSLPAALTLNTPVTITSQPERWVKELGDAVTFSVTADGTGPLRYQWRKDGVSIEGATGPVHSIPFLATTDLGNYDVVVSGACGGATSGAGWVTLSAPQPFALEALRSPNGADQLKLAGQVGRSYSLQSSTNLVDWIVWTNFVAQSASQLLPAARATNTPVIFYRATSP